MRGGIDSNQRTKEHLLTIFRCSESSGNCQRAQPTYEFFVHTGLLFFLPTPKGQLHSQPSTMDSASASSEKRQQLQVVTSSSSVDLDALQSPTSTYSSESGIGTKSNNDTDDEVIQCQGAVNNECIDVGSPFCGDLGDWCTPSRQFASTKTEEGPEHVQVPADSNTKEIEHFDFEEKTSATQATSNRSRTCQLSLSQRYGGTSNVQNFLILCVYSFDRERL